MIRTDDALVIIAVRSLQHRLDWAWVSVLDVNEWFLWRDDGGESDLETQGCITAIAGSRTAGVAPF